MGFFKALDEIIQAETERQKAKMLKNDAYIEWDENEPEQAALISIYKSALTNGSEYYVFEDAKRIYRIAEKTNNDRTKSIAIRLLGSISEHIVSTYYKSEITKKIDKLF